jgi:large subunit ribosomal protein L7/L12
MSDDDNKKAEDGEEEAQDAAEKAEAAVEKVEAAVEKAEEVKEEIKEVASEAKEEKKTDKKSVSVSPSLEKIIKSIEELSVLELSELVKALEDKFGVTAAAPMVASSGTPAAGGEETTSEQTTFNVILAESGANKISVIKAVRELVQTLGLKEAKDLVDAAPKPVLEGVNKETATEAKAKLEAAGAKVELK